MISASISSRRARAVLPPSPRRRPSGCPAAVTELRRSRLASDYGPLRQLRPDPCIGAAGRTPEDLSHRNTLQPGAGKPSRGRRARGRRPRRGRSPPIRDGIEPGECRRLLRRRRSWVTQTTTPPPAPPGVRRATAAAPSTRPVNLRAARRSALPNRCPSARIEQTVRSPGSNLADCSQAPRRHRSCRACHDPAPHLSCPVLADVLPTPAHSSASNSRRKAASARRNPVSVNTTDLALLTGSEISPFR